MILHVHIPPTIEQLEEAQATEQPIPILHRDGTFMMIVDGRQQLRQIPPCYEFFGEDAETGERVRMELWDNIEATILSDANDHAPAH